MGWSSDFYSVGPWGGSYAIGAKDLLMFCRMGPNFRSITEIIDERWAHLFGMSYQILLSFNLDDAVGDQLDKVGSWLDFERGALTDAKYRKALRVQKTILAATGTATNLQNIFNDWVETFPDEYMHLYPATINISGVVPVDDQSLLVQFLESAAPAGVRLSIFGLSEPFLICDGVTTPVTDPGLTDGVTTPVVGARPTAGRLYA